MTTYLMEALLVLNMIHQRKEQLVQKIIMMLKEKSSVLKSLNSKVEEASQEWPHQEL